MNRIASALSLAVGLAALPGALLAQVGAAADSGNFEAAKKVGTSDARDTEGASAGQGANPAREGKGASYSIGLFFGSQLHSTGVQDALALDELVRGLREGLAGKLPGDEEKQLMNDTLRSARAALAERNREQAKAFLAENGKVPGVVTTASGLQYTVFKAGDANGKKPGPRDRVTIQYRGRLLDGTQFDSSEQHAMAASFSLNGGVIPGWKESILLMTPGTQWRVFVPPDLAYGNSPPPGIPAGSMLVYDMQLQKIDPPAPAPAGGDKRTLPAPTRKPPR